MSGIKRGERQIVAILKFFPIEMKGVGGLAAGTAIPAVGEDDASNVEEQRRDFGHLSGNLRQ